MNNNFQLSWRRLLLDGAAGVVAGLFSAQPGIGFKMIDRA